MKKLSDGWYWYSCLGFSCLTALLVIHQIYGMAAFGAIMAITHGVRWSLENVKADD